MRRFLLFLMPLLLAVPACGRSQVIAVADEKSRDKDTAREVSADAKNWSFWRGPEQNGVSREKDLPEKWSLAKKENLVFATSYSSISSPIVQNNVVYLVGRTGEGETQQETVAAFDADTGKLKWEKKYNVWHTDIVDDRLSFTQVCGDPETGNVYAHLTSGMFICFDKNGKEIWSRSLTEEFGRVSGYGGRITSPIIDEDKVILSLINGSWGDQTVGNTRMVAFDKKKGNVIWWASGNRQVKDTYSGTPAVGVIGGQRLIVTGSGDGHVHAFQVRTGKKVWSVKIDDGSGAINCSPVIKGNKVWIGHGEENADSGTQGRVVCIDGSEVKDGEAKVLWKHDGVKVKFAAPILHEGLLYVCDDLGKLYCFNADKGGEPLWSFEYGSNTKGSPVWADGKIYLGDVDSKFKILQPAKDECKQLHEQRFRGKGFVKVELHGTPAVVNGRVYFTTTEQLICIGKKDHKAKPDKIPDAVKEDAAKKGGEAAHIQVVPADLTLKPGESGELKAFAYDKDGRALGEVKVTWAREGVRPPVFPPNMPQPKPAKVAPPAIAGKLSEESGVSTKFTAAEKPNGAFGTIVAKMDKLTGEARVRVVPVLPYTMDFSAVPLERTPGGWVNAPGKFSVVERGKEKLLFKRNDAASPLIRRANAYIGSPDLKDYTIESDVFGEPAGTDMPDIGVSACRYTLLLAGNSKEVRLGTWDAQKRVIKTTPLEWKSGVWYRMKLTATVADGKGVVKGKVWPRDEKEPEAWTLEITDPVPNEEGSPALYGNAEGLIDAKNKASVIYFANVKVTPNKK
jgi:outer membrane protein assembly factor BamB